MVSKRFHRSASWFGQASLVALLLVSGAAVGQTEGSAAAAEGEAAPGAESDAAASEADDETASDASDSEGAFSDEKADASGPASTAASDEGVATPAAEAPTAGASSGASEANASADDEGGFEDDGAEEFSDEELSDEDLGGFDEVSDEPGLGERRLVAYVATGVAAAAFVTGGVFAFLAWQQYQCVADVVECNKTLDDPIVGEELFDARAEIEYKALGADMAFLFGAAAALVAGTGYVRGFIFTGEDDGADAADDEAVTLQGLPPLPRVATQPSVFRPSATNDLFLKGAGHE